MRSPIERRLAALETVRQPTATYVVEMQDDAEMQDAAAVEAAIREHRRVTGWTRPVIVAPAEITMEQWIVEYGRASGLRPPDAPNPKLREGTGDNHSNKGVTQHRCYQTQSSEGGRSPEPGRYGSGL